ncbi:MAG TPA: PQQ-binding-like beta-propeller repeat protein, partial [Thermoplasmata archaeon]|nr:PQQ-binding-like beta-propeller repeat protein [Thermoplasmata archaeon]
MRKIISYIVGFSLLFSGLGIIGISGMTLQNNQDERVSPDLSALLFTAAQSSSSEQTSFDSMMKTILGEGPKSDYPLGTLIWQYQISGGSDNSPKAIAALDDINGDGFDDVVICSEDNNIRCFSGWVDGTGDVLWTHEIYSGNIYQQHGLAITEDINGDGYNDCVVGATGGARLIRCISGYTGQTIWTHDTHEYGDGGWVYQVDCGYDYNGDGIRDVVAATGDDSSGAGPKRVYCLDGVTGESLWERPLGGPGFAAMGVKDFTGDGVPDVLAGCSDEAESDGFGKGINGATGAVMWSYPAAGSSVWGVEQLDDVTGDGIPDVIIGDFSGHIYGLNAATGTQVYTLSIGSVIITRLEQLGDVNSNGYSDIIPAHSTTTTTQVIDGYTGGVIWSHVVADQPWNVARIADITGDDIDDVLLGTLFNTNFVYFLNGMNGSELKKISYGQAVDAIASIPDVIGDGSMEMVAGGRNGKVNCLSGGENATQHQVNITADFSAAPLSGTVPLVVQFTDLSTAENTTITSWAWDFENDGTIDSTEQDPTWTYTENGTFSVSLTVSDDDISDTETKIDYITVLPMGSTIVGIGNITGGLLGVSAEILNAGTLDISSVNWSISLDGGVVLLGRSSSGIIAMIPVGDSRVVADTPIIGFG